MDALSKTSGFSRRNVEDYASLSEICIDVESIKHDNFLLTQACELFERYLRKKSPSMLIGIDRPFEHRGSRGSMITARSLSFSLSRDSVSPTLTLARTSTTSSNPVLSLVSRSALQPSFAAQRINVIYRLEMVERELEEGKMTMDKLRNRFKSAKFLLQTEEENLREELEAIQECEKAFQNFIVENTDKKTGRVFHDKFLRFLENELQLKDRELRKMKLKTKTFQIEYNRMKSQQQQKLELREHLHPVDLDKLHIENEKHLQTMEQKTKHLQDLKKAVGKKGQNLVYMKTKLNDTNLALKNIRQDLKQKEDKYVFLESKKNKNVNELIAAEALNQSIKRINTAYRSPDIHSYLKISVALSDMKAEKETWERRCRNQKQTLTLLEHQLRQLAPAESLSIARSVRSIRSAYSSRSVDSLLRRSRIKTPFPHCTPTTPL